MTKLKVAIALAGLLLSVPAVAQGQSCSKNSGTNNGVQGEFYTYEDVDQRIEFFQSDAGKVRDSSVVDKRQPTVLTSINFYLELGEPVGPESNHGVQNTETGQHYPSHNEPDSDSQAARNSIIAAEDSWACTFA